MPQSVNIFNGLTTDNPVNIGDASGVGTNQQTILARVFADTAAGFMGVPMPAVGIGEASYPVFGDGASAALVAKGTAKNAEAETIGELSDAMPDAAILAPVVPCGQGYKDSSEDIRLFKTALLEGRVKPCRSLLRSAIAETRLIQDPAGNQKTAKSGEGTRRRNGRDDPAVAAVQAVALAERIPKPPDADDFEHIPLDVL